MRGSKRPWSGTLALALTALVLGACTQGSRTVNRGTGGPPSPVRASASPAGAAGEKTLVPRATRATSARPPVRSRTPSPSCREGDSRTSSDACREEMRRWLGTTMASFGRYERVTWEQASEWWPYGDLLRPPLDGRWSGGEEVVFAAGTPTVGAGRGRAADPRREQAGVVAVYQRQPVTVDNGSETEVTDAGGFVYDVEFFPGGTLRVEEERQRYVTVRGNRALLVEGFTDITPEESQAHPWRMRSNIERRTLSWYRVVPGGILWFELRNGSRRYSEDETLAFAEAMQPM